MLGGVVPLAVSRESRNRDENAVGPFYFDGLLLGREVDERGRGKRRWALLRSSTGTHFLSAFNDKCLAQGDGSKQADAEAVRRAFQDLASRKVKTVSNIIPVHVSSSKVTRSSSGGGGGGDGRLSIPTNLKSIGPDTLMGHPSPEIRRTAAARLSESPRDARWFNGVDVKIPQPHCT